MKKRKLLIHHRIIILNYILYKRIKRNKRKFWVHPIFVKRSRYGEYHHLMPDLRIDPEKFFNYLRMDMATYELLKSLLFEEYFKNIFNVMFYFFNLIDYEKHRSVNQFQ